MFRRIRATYRKFILNVQLPLTIVIGLLLGTAAHAQSTDVPQRKQLNNKVRLNFIPVSMPQATYPSLDKTMGLMGLHYLIPFNDWLYGGAGMYAAITGDQGGLFTLGATLGINKKLYKSLYLDANFHFGGGGGYRYLVNDGGYINSNIGLQLQQKHYAVGVQYSHFDFYSGAIKSNAVSVFVEIPSLLRFTDYRHSQQKFELKQLEKDQLWQQPVVKNAQQLRFDFFKPIGSSQKDNGTPLRETLYVLGFEYQKYLDEKSFLFVHTDAIYKGLRAGFMDLFFGMGYHPIQSTYVDVFTKFAVGAAGGRVAPEGGLMLYPSAGIDLKLSQRFRLSTHGGYYRAIGGTLEAYTFGFGIKYTNFSGGTQKSNQTDRSNYRIQGISLSLENQTYLGVAKTDDSKGLKEVDLQLLAFQVNYDLTKNLYLIGEAGFAYDGRSGGYAHGLVGMGVKSPSFLSNHLEFFIDATGGAAGGAGVDTDEGIVARLVAGINVNVNNTISITSSVGQFIAPFGNVNATNINIGCNFNFGSLTSTN